MPSLWVAVMVCMYLIRRCEPHSERSQAGCMYACLHVFLRAFSCCSTACLSYWDGVGTLITDMFNDQVAVPRLQALLKYVGMGCKLCRTTTNPSWRLQPHEFANSSPTSSPSSQSSTGTQPIISDMYSLRARYIISFCATGVHHSLLGSRMSHVVRIELAIPCRVSSHVPKLFRYLQSRDHFRSKRVRTCWRAMNKN